jgi:hypothetical protein
MNKRRLREVYIAAGILLGVVIVMVLIGYLTS